MLYHPSVSFYGPWDWSRVNDSLQFSHLVGSLGACQACREGWVLAGPWEGTGRTDAEGILIGVEGPSLFQSSGEMQKISELQFA